MTRIPYTHLIVDRSIRIARLPVDVLDSFLPDRPDAVGAKLSLAVDGVDARVRGLAGALLNDPQLTEEADLLRRATDERRRAADLSGLARDRFETGEERLDRSRETAEQRRERANDTAARRREQADAERRKRREKAQKTAERREHAVAKQAERRDDDAEHDVNVARLRAADDRRGALADREEALQTREDARDLGEAADELKAVRKSAG